MRMIEGDLRFESPPGGTYDRVETRLPTDEHGESLDELTREQRDRIVNLTLTQNTLKSVDWLPNQSRRWQARHSLKFKACRTVYFRVGS